MSPLDAPAIFLSRKRLHGKPQFPSFAVTMVHFIQPDIAFYFHYAYWCYCTQLGMRFKTFTRTSFPIHHKELGHIITSHGRIPDSRRSKLSSTSPWLAPSLTFRGILGWSMFIYYICNYHCAPLQTYISDVTFFHVLGHMTWTVMKMNESPSLFVPL